MLFGLFSTPHEKNIAFKQREREERIAALPAVYTESITRDEQALLNRPAREVVDLVKKGELDPLDVLHAYGKRTIEAQAAINPVTEVMIKDAEEWAKNCNRKGPLAGFPISLKDTINVKGYDSTVGYSKYVGQPHTNESPVIKLLRDAGAVPFVKTNIPLTLHTVECYNDLWGVTENPYKKGYTPGGSSGGEGALVAFGGSRLGIGTDVAGSVRVPAHFCGIYSLRPSTERFPSMGGSTSAPGQDGIPSVTGPMCRSLDDLSFFMKTIVDMKPWEYDFSCIPLPWREIELPRKLKFGVMWSDGIVDPSPACRRALQMTVDAVKKQGHEFVDFVIPDALYGHNIGAQCICSDGLEQCSGGRFFGERNDKGVDRALWYGRLPRFVKRIYAWFVEHVWGDKVWATVLRDFNHYTIGEHRQHIARKYQWRQKVFEAWKDSGIDFLLTVPHSTPAFPHHTFYDSFTGLDYTFFFNILDYSAGVLPVTHVDREKDALPADFKLSKLNGIARGTYKHYDADKMHGLPVGVQIVGRRNEDEKVLKGMELLESALHADGVVFNQPNSTV